MAENSAIEWTDHTFNPWIGCTKVHSGCANCYAEADQDLRRGRVKWGPAGTRSKTKTWGQPVKWNRDAVGAGGPTRRLRVFCASLADVFEDWQGPIVDHEGCSLWRCANCGTTKAGAKPPIQKLGPACCGPPSNPLTMGDLRRDLFALIDATPHLDWLLLTKRPENILRMWCEPNDGRDVSPTPHSDGRHNVWLGTSISDQASADKQIPALLACRDLSPVLFLSCEPLLGPVDLKPRPPELRGGCIVEHRHDGTQGPCQTRGIDWVIAGGESGHNARPLHPDWVRGLRDQCEGAGVPFFFKQWGEWLPQLLAGRLLDGREWSEFPRVAVTAAD